MTNSYYIQRISKVVDYIEENIGQKLTLEELADVAMFSKFHFHRIFKSVIGETLNEFIKRTKLIKAYRLLQVDKSFDVKELAFTFGYNSTANFSRDFKKYHGVSPSEVKLSDKVLEERVMNCSEDELKIEYKGIEFIPDKFIAYKKVTTGYNTKVISTTFKELYHLALENNFRLEQFIGIGYDDPDYTPADKCKYDACMVVNEEDLPKDIACNTKTLKAGKFALFYFEGHEKDISSAWDYIFKEWLLNSKYLPDDRPHLEMYLYSEQYESGIFKSNLCLPIKPI